MDFRFPQANGTQTHTAEPSGNSRRTVSNRNMSFSSSRTSSKRSFDEYGHQSTPGPSGSSSTTPVTSMGGAGAVLGLGSSSSVGNHLVDPANNAHNARHKRRRGSLSPPQGESSLHTPSMPVGASSSESTSVSVSTRTQHQASHSASNSAESVMAWMSDPAPHSQMTTQRSDPPSSTLNEIAHDSFFRDNNDNLYESRPESEYRDNRMSWMPETTTTDTVTTNTEPGWNFGPHDRHTNLGPPMDFSMPNAQSVDAPNQQPALHHFLERNSYESNTEINMPIPSFHSDIRPETAPNFDSPHHVSPRSLPSLYIDSWFRPLPESRRVVQHRQSPSPPRWHSPPPQPPSDPAPSETSSWWPLRWSSYADGGTSPPPVPRRARPNAGNPTHQARPSSPPLQISVPHSNLERGSSATHRAQASPLDGLASRPWNSETTTPRQSPRTEMPHWPPYHLSTIDSPTSQFNFPEPHVLGGSQGNSRYSPDRADRSIDNTFHRHLQGVTPAPAFGFINSSFSSFGNPIANSASQPRDRHAFPVPNVTSPTQRTNSLYSAGGERVQFQEDATRVRTSGRVPSPPPTRRTILALHEILDRHTHSHQHVSDVDTNMRGSHHRSNSDMSPIDPYQSRSQNSAPQRHVERLEEMRESVYNVPEQARPSDIFTLDRSTGPSSTNRSRASRQEPRARPTSSFYDHPSMRDLISSHSNNPHERDRRELHSSLARTQLPPPPPSRRPLSGLFDYTRSGNSGSNSATQAARQTAAVPDPPRASRATPMRSISPVSSRPFPPFPTSRGPPSPASRPSPFRLDPSPPTEPLVEQRSGSIRRNQRRRESRVGRLLGAENPFAWLGSDDDFPIYDSFHLEDTELSGLSITAAERIRNLSRFRAGRHTLRAVPVGRMRTMGDYVLDDDFDESYEALLALGQFVGPVKRGCSDDTLVKLPHGTYGEFSASSSDENSENKILGDNGNCAICLEDYQPTDMCTKLPRCLHFYHKDCVKEWLKTAKTCPVCRENVEGPPRVKGNSRPARVRFVPIAEQRESQNPQMQHLRNTSGPSSSGAATVSVPRPSRRRSNPDNHPTPQPAPVMESDREGSRVGRFRRLRMPPRMESTILGELDDQWPTHSPPSPPNMFTLHHRRSHTPPPFMLDMPSTSSRFGEGMLARALHEGHIDDMFPSLPTYN